MKRLLAALGWAFAFAFASDAYAQIVVPTILRPSTPAQITSYDTGRVVTAYSLDGGAVRIVCTTDCYIAIGPSPHASVATGMLLYQNSVNIFGIRRGERVGVIQSTAGGYIHVQELSR